MHAEGYAAMGALIGQFAAGMGKRASEALQVLDVGSRDFNGSYRPLIEARGWQYTGLDLVDGPNVDLVSGDPYSYPIDAGAFDLVISGSTMEHVPAIWRWVPEVVRVLRPGGMVAIVTHWQYQEHGRPDLGFRDYWRIMPDGLRFLFEQAGELERSEVAIVSEYDIAGSAWKRRRGIEEARITVPEQAVIR